MHQRAGQNESRVVDGPADNARHYRARNRFNLGGILGWQDDGYERHRRGCGIPQESGRKMNRKSFSRLVVRKEFRTIVALARSHGENRALQASLLFAVGLLLRGKQRGEVAAQKLLRRIAEQFCKGVIAACELSL